MIRPSLSKRVRHGSIVGYLRGPFESEDLVTQRESEFGAYKPNTFWPSRFSDVSESRRQELQGALSRFGESLDQEFLTLKNELLQIRSKDHPRGVFDVTLSPQAFHLIRSTLKAELTLDNLFAITFIVLWTLLTPSLREAQNAISERLRGRIAELVDQLRADVQKSVGDSTHRAELTMAIGKASYASQQAIENVSAWFDKTDVERLSRTYTLREAVEIAIESAASANKSTEMRVAQDVPADVKVPGGRIPIVGDAIFSILGNIAKHSRLKRPQVKLVAQVNPGTNRATIRVESEIAAGVRTKEGENRLSTIRQQIAEGTFGERVAKDSESGLAKLASTIGQSADGRLEFGFLDDHRFSVEVDLEFDSGQVANP